MTVSRFRYIADPVCLISLAIYWIGRLVLRPNHIGGTFVHDYFNDLFCLPLFLPPILWLQKCANIRKGNAPPQLWEIAQHAAVFSILFELILPRFPHQFHTTADPWDTLMYFIGGMMAWTIWNREFAWQYARHSLKLHRKKCVMQNQPTHFDELPCFRPHE